MVCSVFCECSDLFFLSSLDDFDAVCVCVFCSFFRRLFVCFCLRVGPFVVVGLVLRLLLSFYAMLAGDVQQQCDLTQIFIVLIYSIPIDL